MKLLDKLMFSRTLARISVLLLTVILIGIILVTGRQNLASQQFFPPPTLTPPNYLEATSEVTDGLRERYSPAHFGLPDTIAGYPVIAVRSAENTACMPDWELRLQIQTTASTFDEYLAGNIGSKIQQAVDALGKPGVTISVSGPGSSLETLIRENERWNEGRRQYGCGNENQSYIHATFEPNPEITLTPVWFDRSTYTPAMFGIPDSIGGYEILAILSEENVSSTGCGLPGIARILVRAKRSVDEEYTFGDHQALQNGLQRTFALQSVIEFVEPDTTETEVNEIIEAQLQRLASRGCPTLRLGHFIVEPIPTIP